MKSYTDCAPVFQPMKIEECKPTKPVNMPTATGGAKKMPYIGGLQPNCLAEKKTF